MKTLLEDLQKSDLKNLVRPIIEIDAYKAKIDEKNIVVTFKVSQEDPAYDLSRFIEFSSAKVLDTEVSEVPDQHGNYLVFVEFSPSNLAKKIYDMLVAVSYLTDNNKWIYKAWGKKDRLTVK